MFFFDECSEGTYCRKWNPFLGLSSYAGVCGFPKPGRPELLESDRGPGTSDTRPVGGGGVCGSSKGGGGGTVQESREGRAGESDLAKGREGGAVGHGDDRHRKEGK